MKIKDIIKIISLGLASFSFTVCLLLYGKVSGFEQGYSAAIKREFPDTSSIVFSGQGSTIYEVIGEGYIIIAFCFYIYIAGKIIKKSFLYHALCFLPLLVIAYQYWQMFQYKNKILSAGGDFPSNVWIISSIQFDWLCFFITIVLLIIQVTPLFIYHFGKNDRIT